MRKTWSQELRVEAGRFEGYPWLRLFGEGARRGAGPLEALLAELLARGETRVILDTRDLLFFDPGCVELLAHVAERFGAEGGALVAVDRSLPLERALKLLDLERAIPVFSTPAQAAQYLDEHD